jgi:tetratricopeptide (TPR) repeat protein
MRAPLLWLLLCAPALLRAAPAPQRLVVAILPPAADPGSADLALGIHTRATALLAQTGRYHEVHLKQVLRMAEREGLSRESLSTPAGAARAGRRLGTGRVVYGTLRQQDGALTLTAAALRDGGPDRRAAPVTVRLPSALPAAVEAGALALAQLAARADGVALPARPRPLTASAEALAAYLRCHAVVVQQPVGIEHPVVLEGAQLKEAVRACRAAVAADAKLGAAWAALGLALALAGEDSAAVQALSRVQKGEDYLPLYWLGRYWLVTRYQSAAAGETALRRAIERHPHFLLAWGYLAEHHSALREDTAALSAWQAYLAQVPGSAFLRGRISHSLARLGRHDEALKEARAALELVPDNREAALELASRHLDAGQPAEAITLLLPLARRPEARGEILLRLGYAYLRQGDLLAAEPWLRRAEAAAARPGEWRTRARARLDLGKVLIKLGRVEEGQRLLVAALQGGLRGYIAAQKDEELQRMVQQAEKAQKSRRVELFRFTRPPEASPFPLDGAGDIAAGTKPLPAPAMFEVLRF